MNPCFLILLCSLYWLFCTQVTAAPHNGTSVTTPPATFNNTTTVCPEGTHDCGFFKCVKEPTCPLDCKWYDNKPSCNRIRLNGVGCAWRGNSCYRDIQCKSLPGNQCSEGCMDCGHYKCIPDGGACPAGCDSYRNKKSCQSATVFNGIGCQWLNTTCRYRQFEVRIAKPSAGENHVGSTSSITVNSEQSKNNPLAVSPGADPEATMDMKNNSLAGPIAGGVVGLIAMGCMAFVLLHKRSEAQKQSSVHSEAKLPEHEVPKTLYRPQSLLYVVRSVLGINSNTQHNPPP